MVNRALTFFQNSLVFRRKLSEYHTGYRAFARNVLLAIPFELNDNDFVFDAQILAQLVACRFRIGEVACPTKYFPEASSIGLASGIRYAWAASSSRCRSHCTCAVSRGSRTSNREMPGSDPHQPAVLLDLRHRLAAPGSPRL